MSPAGPDEYLCSSLRSDTPAAANGAAAFQHDAQAAHLVGAKARRRQVAKSRLAYRARGHPLIGVTGDHLDLAPVRRFRPVTAGVTAGRRWVP